MGVEYDRLDVALINAEGKNVSLGYCPVIRMYCKPDCICYVKVKVVPAPDKVKFVITEPWCIHNDICEH